MPVSSLSICLNPHQDVQCCTKQFDSTDSNLRITSLSDKIAITKSSTIFKRINRSKNYGIKSLQPQIPHTSESHLQSPCHISCQKPSLRNLSNQKRPSHCNQRSCSIAKWIFGVLEGSVTRQKRPQCHRPRQMSLQFFILCIVFSLFTMVTPEMVQAAIGCFVCSSVNGSNPICEDTFNSSVLTAKLHGSVGIYQYPCWAFRKERQGLFPADHCIKVSGYRSDNNKHTVLIRTCALDSGTLTADTEIVRVSHCGHFKYEGLQYTGCVQSCDTDGCNTAIRPSLKSHSLLSINLFIIVISQILWNVVH